jgi:hypothetical protein
VPLERRLGGIQGVSGRYGEYTNVNCRQQTVAVPTELTRIQGSNIIIIIIIITPWL